MLETKDTKREKRGEKRGGAGVCACVWASLSITQSWDSLLTSQAVGPAQSHRLGPAGNWWSARCHADHISTRLSHTPMFFFLFSSVCNTKSNSAVLQWPYKTCSSKTINYWLVASKSISSTYPDIRLNFWLYILLQRTFATQETIPWFLSRRLDRLYCTHPIFLCAVPLYNKIILLHKRKAVF